MNSLKKISILPIFLTVLIDMIGVGIIIPVFAVILLRPDTGLLPPETAESTRLIMIGFLIAAYPIAQFFGAPILGSLSDRFGRKIILILSLAGTVFGYLLFAYGITANLLIILFLGRILDGFTGGNISIAMSAIADISDAKEKAKNFGLVGMAFGFGFILGPAIGGKLSDSSLVSWFNFATPFWFAAGLTVLNIFFILWKFEETFTSSTKRPMSLLTGFHNIAKAFRLTTLRTMLLVVFLLTLGFNFFTQFFQVFLIQKFAYTQSDIGNIFAFIGLCIAFVQGILTRPLSKRFVPTSIMSFCALGLACTLPALILPSESWMLYVLLPFVAVFNGLTYPNANAIISNLADAESQGEVLGINQSMQALAMAIPPIIAGFIVTIDRNLPILTAGVLTLAAWFVFEFAFRRPHFPKQEIIRTNNPL